MTRPAGRRWVGFVVGALAASLLAVLPAPARAAGPAPALVTLRSADGGFSFQPWLVGADGALRRLTAQSALSQPAISPDGSRLAFSGPVGNDDSLGRYAIFTIGLDGSALRQVTDPRFGDLDPSWSPDSTQLVFTRSTDGSLTTACCELYTAAADGSGLRSIPNTRNGRQAVFSGDGGSVIFVGTGGLRTVGLTGAGERLVSAGAYADPSLSPDGTRVAVTLLRSPSRSDLGVVELTGTITQVSVSGGRVEDPQWSSDGGTLYYLEHAGQGYLGRLGSVVRSVPSAGGPSAVVADPPGEIVELATLDAAHQVFGNLERFTQTPGAVHAVGWAVDPDTTAPVDIEVVVDVTVVSRTEAAGARPDVATAFPGVGPAHGFDVTVSLDDGPHRVCIRARDTVAPGLDPVVLGCQTLRGSPVGSLDTVSRAPAGASVRGWALDPDTADPVVVSVSVDGREVSTVPANGSRPDVGAAHPGYGADHGFVSTVALGAGSHAVCVTALDTTGRAPGNLLGCRTLVVDGNPFGALDTVRPAPGGVSVTGWAIDPDTADPVGVHVYVDGVGVAVTSANASRPDVGAAYPAYGANRGYTVAVPVPTGSHRVCVYAISVGPGQNTLLRCTTVARSGTPLGRLDSVTRTGSGTRIQGWALDPDRGGPVQVHVYLDGRAVAVLDATASRPDVAQAYPGWGPQHGLDVVVPVQGAQVCLYAIDAEGGPNPLLRCATG